MPLFLTAIADVGVHRVEGSHTDTAPPSLTATSSLVIKRRGPGPGSAAALRGGRAGDAAAYLRAEVRALDAELDAGGTLELGILAAALCLALPSGLGARHACVCWRGGVAGKQPARGGKRRMCAAAGQCYGELCATGENCAHLAGAVQMRWGTW